MTTFGQRVRELLHMKEWSSRDLAERVDVSFTYLSQVEGEHLNFGDYLSNSLIHRSSEALKADEEELLILAKQEPEGKDADLSATRCRLRNS